MNDIDEIRPYVVRLLDNIQRLPKIQINLDVYWRPVWVRDQPCGCVGGWAFHLFNEQDFGVFERYASMVDVSLFAGYLGGIERELTACDLLIDVTHKNAALYRLLRLVLNETRAKQEIVEYATYGRDLAAVVRADTGTQPPAKVGVADLPPIPTLHRVIR